jgi:hypothetical protein
VERTGERTRNATRFKRPPRSFAGAPSCMTIPTHMRPVSATRSRNSARTSAHALGRAERPSKSGAATLLKL